MASGPAAGAAPPGGGGGGGDTQPDALRVHQLAPPEELRGEGLAPYLDRLTGRVLRLLAGDAGASAARSAGGRGALRRAYAHAHAARAARDPRARALRRARARAPQSPSAAT